MANACEPKRRSAKPVSAFSCVEEAMTVVDKGKANEMNLAVLKRMDPDIEQVWCAFVFKACS